MKTSTTTTEQQLPTRNYRTIKGKRVYDLRTPKEPTPQEEAIAYLSKILEPGTKVYTILRHRSASGMSRVISVFVCVNGDAKNIDWYVANALDYKRDDKHDGGIKMGGCGMDMGFALVYNLGRKLYPEGFKLAKGQYGRNGDKSGFDKDGGYALKQEWL